MIGSAPPAATPGSGPSAAAATADADVADAPPADVQAAYVAQYMATVARLAAAQAGTGDQKKPKAEGAGCCQHPCGPESVAALHRCPHLLSSSIMGAELGLTSSHWQVPGHPLVIFGL